MKAWNFDDIPSRHGRTAIVTGANTGIGFETARMLALTGADVVLACRNADKAEAACKRIVAEEPKARVAAASLDLSDLDSVSRFADTFLAAHEQLDLLINNAGVMAPPLAHTKQGYELQFGTNHIGHFALTARLLPLLERTPKSRIVVVSSGMQNRGRIDFDDINWQRRKYGPMGAYSQSKLANMMFALELQRRLSEAESRVLVTAAHPGATKSDLARTSTLARLLGPLIAMETRDGAWSTLRAAIRAAQ